MKSLTAAALASALIFGCGDTDKDDAADSAAPTVTTVGEITDTSVTGITTFLQKGDYKTWAAETAVHSSSGPHGKVRSFFNATLTTSIKAGSKTHPKDSISVKELYEADGTTLKGYAVEAKTVDGTGADSWLWYEGFTPKFNEYYGQGLTTCTGCHSSGTDFVKSGPSL
jgi:hypothetical protein